MRLILVRHGATDWNDGQRVQGQSDTILNQRGQRQAEAIAQALKEEKLEAIYSSPLKRALETARAIARLHGLAITLEPRLMEADVGALDGLTFVQMREHYGDLLRQWASDAASVRLAGGETLQEVQDRAWAAVTAIHRQHPAGTVAVVSHNFVIGAVICCALGLELSHLRRLRQALGGITILHFRPQGVALALFNDTCHLEAVP